MKKWKLVRKDKVSRTYRNKNNVIRCVKTPDALQWQISRSHGWEIVNKEYLRALN